MSRRAARATSALLAMSADQVALASLDDDVRVRRRRDANLSVNRRASHFRASRAIFLLVPGAFATFVRAPSAGCPSPSVNPLPTVARGAPSCCTTRLPAGRTDGGRMDDVARDERMRRLQRVAYGAVASDAERDAARAELEALRREPVDMPARVTADARRGTAPHPRSRSARRPDRCVRSPSGSRRPTRHPCAGSAGRSRRAPPRCSSAWASGGMSGRAPERSRRIRSPQRPRSPRPS